jgi:plastocyanin
MKTIFTSAKTFYKQLLSVIILLLSSIITYGQTLHVVEVRDSQFDPDELEIVVGDTVEWRNVMGSHNVNGTQASFPSNPESFGNQVGEGWTLRHVFTTAGNYNYQCDPHVAVGMTGSISVREDASILTVEFIGMNPHVGQDFYLALIDSISGKEVSRVHTIADVSFSVEVAGIQPGHSYHVDFWADHNRNGMYDTPPADHAWRLKLNDVTGDTMLTFAHNTSFTDIRWKNMLTVEFSGMNPHLGQMLVLYVVDSNDLMVLDTVTIEALTEADFSVSSPSLTAGGSYFINFFADFNDNGAYDAPPTDHAWQLVLENVSGDTTLTFIHNTSFTDIFPVTSASETERIIFRMYPNPAYDKVWIEAASLSSGNYKLAVYDITGKLIRTKPEYLGGRIELNIQSFNEGIYFVEINTVSNRNVLKLIKK